MTNPTPHGQVPEALNQLFEKLEDCIYEWSNYVRADDAPTTLPKYTAGAIKDLRVAVAELYHRALRNAHVQNPAEQGAYETGWKDGYKHGAWSAQQQVTQHSAANFDRQFLERVLSAMEGVIDVADRKTDEFDALRSCIIDLTLMLFKPEAALRTQQPAPAGAAPECLTCNDHGAVGNILTAGAK